MPETKPKPKYASTTQHHDSYFLACILLFIAGLTANQTHAQIAQRLNEADLQTVTGSVWDSNAVSQVLKRVRLNRDYRSSFHQALLRLVYSGQLTVAQTMPLFQIRTTGVHQ